MLSNPARQQVFSQNTLRKPVKVRKSVSDPSLSVGSGAESDYEPQYPSIFHGHESQRHVIQVGDRTYQRIPSREYDFNSHHQRHRQRSKFRHCRETSPEIYEYLEPRELIYTPPRESRLRRKSSARLRPERSDSVVSVFRADCKLKQVKSFTEAVPVQVNNPLRRRPSSRLLVAGPFVPKPKRSLRGERGHTPVPINSVCSLQQFYEQVEAERNHQQLSVYRVTRKDSFASARNSESRIVHPAYTRSLGYCGNAAKDTRSRIFQAEDPEYPPAHYQESPSEIRLSRKRSSRLGLPPLPPNASSKHSLTKQSVTDLSRSEDLPAEQPPRLLTATLSQGDTVGKAYLRRNLRAYKPAISFSTPSCVHRIPRPSSRPESRQPGRSRLRVTESCTDLHAKYLTVSEPCITNKCPICVESGNSSIHLPTMQSRYMTDLEWRICHAVNIYVYQNGVENKQPILIHIPPGKKRSMKAVLGIIHERLKFPIGFAKTLYKMDGTRVRDPCELEMYNNYVVSNNYDKHFKCVQYGRKRSPLIVLNRESKHIRQLRLHNDQYDQFLIKKAAAGDERPQYVYPTIYTSDGFGPADLPVGTGGNYQPCGPVCKLPKQKCDKQRHPRETYEYDDDGMMGDIPEQPNYPSYNNPNYESQSMQAQNRVNFPNNPIVNQVSIPPVKLKNSGELFPKKKEVAAASLAADIANNNVNNNLGASSTTTNMNKYRNLGDDEEDSKFYSKKRGSQAALDSSTGKSKTILANASRSNRKHDNIVVQPTIEEGSETELDNESDYEESISAPTPSYTLVKPKQRTETLFTRRIQTLEDIDSATISGTTLENGSPRNQNGGQARRFSKQCLGQPQQRQQGQNHQQQYESPDQDDRDIAVQQALASQRFVEPQRLPSPRMSLPQQQSFLRAPPPEQQRSNQQHQESDRLVQQALKFAQQLQQTRNQPESDSPERFLQPQAPRGYFGQQDPNPPQFFRQNDQRQPNSFLPQDQHRSQGFIQQLERPPQMFGQQSEQQRPLPTYFGQFRPQQNPLSQAWIPVPQASGLSQFTMPAFQSSLSPQTQQVYNMSALNPRDSRTVFPLPPPMLFNPNSFSTGFIPGVRVSQEQQTRPPQTQNEEVDIPYTPLDGNGSNRPLPALMRRSMQNQQSGFNAKPPVPKVSKRNVAIQMGIPESDISNPSSTTNFDSGGSGQKTSCETNNNKDEPMRPVEMIQLLRMQNENLRLQQAVMEHVQVAQVMESSRALNLNQVPGPSVVYQPLLVQETAPPMMSSHYSGRYLNNAAVNPQQNESPDPNYYARIPNSYVPPPTRFADNSHSHSSSVQQSSSNNGPSHGHQQQQQPSRSSRNPGQHHQQSQSQNSNQNPQASSSTQATTYAHEDYVYINGRKSQVNMNPKRSGK